MLYDWPGNVRELENAVEHGVTMVTGGEIQLGDLPKHLQQQAIDRLHEASEAVDSSRAAAQEGIVPLAVRERDEIFHAIQVTKGDKLQAAKLLGIGKTTLYRKLKEYEAADARRVN
jgi:two-component system response regulator HydG